MAQNSDVPFNVTLLNLTPEKLRGVHPIRVLDIFDGASSNFHPSGLFSTEIFGKVGDERRSTRYAYIDIRIPIFHPVIYRALLELKRLYGGIINGTEYAIWDDTKKDFERSDVLNGATGFSFFLKHWKDIVFEKTKSVHREQNILLIEKYKPVALGNKLLVMPAGLRDIEMGNDGRIREDEINTLYRQMLGAANTIADAVIRTNPELIDRTRFKLQATFNQIYALIESMIDGKKKLIMGKWASRRLVYGTRNVITAMDTSTAYLGAPGAVGFNSTIVGLYQTMKGLTPIAIHLIRNGFLSKVFTSPGAPVKLINKKTLKSESVLLKPEHYDRWMTDEGIEKILTSFGEEGLRDKVLEIEGRYIGLIYKGPDKTFRFIQDIDELPATRDRKDVYPITFCELLYLSGYTRWNDYPCFVTRYPITGLGSIYPSQTLVKTTIKSEIRRELNDRWEPMAEKYTAHEFPIAGPYVNSLQPASNKLARLGADF